MKHYFNIDPETLVSKSDKLLYNIMKMLEPKESGTTAETIPDGQINCKFCGLTHENKGQVMACAKKNKKVG